MMHHRVRLIYLSARSPMLTNIIILILTKYYVLTEANNFSKKNDARMKPLQPEIEMFVRIKHIYKSMNKF